MFFFIHALASKLRIPNGLTQLEKAVLQIKLPGQDSQLKEGE
jgi:hypothetical protein